MVDPSNSDWKLALDLLIARAALDTELASQLTIDAKACCEQNGISLPDHVQLVISKPDQENISLLPIRKENERSGMRRRRRETNAHATQQQENKREREAQRE